MKNIQRFSGLLLASVMSLSLAACSGSTNTDSTQASSDGTRAESTAAATSESGTAAEADSSTAEEADNSAAAETDSSSSSGKVLVAYYSASGNTKRVAENIAEAAGADLFEITPVEPYSSDDLNWTNKESRVSREHDDESLRDVPLTTTEVENWNDYDTVFIGYPIWWGIAAWPVNNFVKDNDFSGKTVIPFATSSSSGLGQSGTLLSEMAGTGDWQDGQRFSSGVSQSDVTDWVNGLGLQG